MKSWSVILIAALGTAAFATPRAASAQHEQHTQGQALRLGTVHFPNSSALAAQEPFLRGLALLHSYEYSDARAAFREAQRADSAFALAYWLEALAHSQFDWGVEDLAAAREALARLAPTPDERLARAGGEAERALGTAVEAFLADGPPLERAQRFAEATRAWSGAAPADVEAAAFAARAALYLLVAAPAAERVQRAEEAIAFAERVVAASPEHPGGLHYLIHATDSPRFAARGLEAARAYDRIAPGAEHALHMPSHIFLQLGMWDDVVASNERSWTASRAWVARGGRDVADLGWHSLEWLQYGYLQQGRFAAAEALIDTALTLVGAATPDELAGYPDVRYTVERLAYQYGVEAGGWDRYPVFDAASVVARVRNETSFRARAMAANAAYHAGVAALYAAQDTAAAGAILRGLQDIAAAAPERDRLRTVLDRAVLQLGAYHAWATGRRHETLTSLMHAAEADREAAGLAPVGPPGMIPLNEALGASLLEAGRPREAVAAYERALEDRPNRSAAWLGLARARRAAGNPVGAREAYARLLANWQNADPDAASLAEARAALAGGKAQ